MTSCWPDAATGLKTRIKPSNKNSDNRVFFCSGSPSAVSQSNSRLIRRLLKKGSGTPATWNPRPFFNQFFRWLARTYYTGIVAVCLNVYGFSLQFQLSFNWGLKQLKQLKMGASAISADGLNQ